MKQGRVLNRNRRVSRFTSFGPAAAANSQQSLSTAYFTISRHASPRGGFLFHAALRCGCLSWGRFGLCSPTHCRSLGLVIEGNSELLAVAPPVHVDAESVSRSIDLAGQRK